jgi:hypothetical protein
MKKSKKEKVQNLHKEVNINIVESKSIIIMQSKTRFYLYQIMKIIKLKKFLKATFPTPIFVNYRDRQNLKREIIIYIFILKYSEVPRSTGGSYCFRLNHKLKTIGKADIRIYIKRMRNNSKKNIIKIGNWKITGLSNLESLII